jgi:Secretion system C-terminal sorting domain
MKILFVITITLLSTLSYSQLRYFEFTVRPFVSTNWQDSSFIAATSNQSIIDSVLVDIQKPLNQRVRHISGFIVQGNGGYNKNATHNFTWHFDENQWNIQGYSIEVCDGKPYTDLDLDAAYWQTSVHQFCPWGSKPSREVFLTGINDNYLYAFIGISPNPVQKNISVLGLTESVKYCIYSQTGQKLSFGDTHGEEINIEFLNQGFYFITLEFKNGKRITKKIIKTEL